MHSNNDNINYWPGFVDAIMNVLLNILFMLCIMAFGLGMVQNQVRESVNDSDDGDKASKNVKQKKGSPSPLTFSTKRVIDTFPVSQIILKPPESPEQVVSTSATSVTAKLSEKNILSLQFTRQSPEMLQETIAHLQKYLPQIAKPSDEIVIWAVNNEDTTANTNKLLFTRLMVVRNALVETGTPTAAMQPALT